MSKGKVMNKEKQEPTNWLWADGPYIQISIEKPELPDAEALYTEPPQRKQLTDDEMKKIWYDMKSIMGWYSFQEIARAIEVAHGITNE